MPNDWDDDDFDDIQNQDETSAFRKLRKAEREKDKALKAAQDELVAIKAQLRERAIKDAIAEKGLNPKIAALVPKDLEGDSIGEFIADYADVFGLQPTPSAQDNPEGVLPADDPVVDSMSRIGEATGSIQPFNGTDAQLEARIKAATSLEELNMLVHKNAVGPVAF